MPRMSRRHFVLRQQDGRWTVQDLGSSNGTLLNRQPVKESGVKDGDVIIAGDTGYQVILGESPLANQEPPGDSFESNQQSNLATWKKDD